MTEPESSDEPTDTTEPAGAKKPADTTEPAETKQPAETKERVEQDAAEDPKAEDEDLDNLRVERHVASEMFGDLYTGEVSGDTFTGITTHAPAQIGNNNTFNNNYLGEQPLDPIIGELPGIDDLMAVYVPTGADDQLDELLKQRATACLVGARNSGRFSTVLAALGRRYVPGRIFEIALPNDVRPDALTRNPERLPEHSGFLLRLPEGNAVDVMRKVGSLFRRRNSTLLLVEDEESRRLDLHGAEVRHQAPDPIEVFLSHLTANLAAGGREVALTYLTDVVAAELKAVSGPKESVAIARAIAKAHPADFATVRAILSRSQPKRRERATTILLPGKDDSATRGRRAGQHERAFRLSYAVFYRRPLHYVFEAAEWLLHEVDSAALRPDWGRMALQHPVQDLLGAELRPDWEAGRDTGNAARGTSRTAWIKDPGLRGAIIDVAWHEFDGTRKSLLAWLDRLVSEGDDVMRRAAAETAGLLVHHDFVRVHKDLVDRWAGSPKPAVRKAAAWTITLSYMAGDVRPAVRAKVSEWCSGTAYQRDTAARVYASGLEQAALVWSLVDLARIGRTPFQRRRHVVAAAVNELYSPERARTIVAELRLWASVRDLQVHAARALMVIAQRIEPESADGRPDLLDRLAEDRVDVADLGLLWLIAFLESTTSPDAAETLARWIGYADADAELRPAVRALLRAITTIPGSRRRIHFYLTKTRDLRRGIPEWTRSEEGQES